MQLSEPIDDIAHPSGCAVPVWTQLVAVSISTEAAEDQQRQDDDEENNETGYQTGVTC